MIKSIESFGINNSSNKFLAAFIQRSDEQISFHEIRLSETPMVSIVLANVISSNNPDPNCSFTTIFFGTQAEMPEIRMLLNDK